MSFKREGSDDQWLNLLKKRRVGDLLAEDVPTEEALVMKNGRLCCLVCHHRPTFDTVEMLSLHRRGKKHETNAAIYYEKQQELDELREKRNHFLHADCSRVTAESSGAKYNGTFLKSAPYNPQLKRKKLKPGERKQVVQLEEGDHVPETTSPAVTASTSLESLPGYGGKQSEEGKYVSAPSQKLPQTIAEYVKRAAIQQKRMAAVRPYQKRGISHTEDSCTTSAQHERGVKIPPSCSSSSTKRPKGATVQKSVKTSMPKQAEVPKIDDEKKLKLQQYLKGTSSGWKLDWTGKKWVRDENVEFDSDEEPPELPNL